MAAAVLQGTLVLADRVVPDGQLVLEEGRISEVLLDVSYVPTHDYHGLFLCPGFLDLHVHGIAGADTMQGDPDSLAHMARRFAAHGVTGFLPTTLTESRDVTRRAVQGMRTYIDQQDASGSVVLGIHLEGPFLNRQYKGMQFEGHLEAPDSAYLNDLLSWAGGHVARVSLAPELPGAAALISTLRRLDIQVSIAHTAATYEQAMEAVLLGATQVTHCFNAMTSLHHRAPGVAGAAMTCDDLTVELIADGIHIHPAVMRMLVRVKGRERVMLVTDSMSAAEMADGQYRFGGHEVTVRGGLATLADGTLASSTLTMDAGVRNLVRLCALPLPDAVYLASSAPAESMHWTHKGKLIAGFDADLAVLTPDFETVATWIAGRCVYESGSSRPAVGSAPGA